MTQPGLQPVKVRTLPDAGPSARTIFWVKFAISGGLLAGFLLTPKLWLSSRLYPLVPVFPFLRPLPPPWDRALFASMLLLSIWILVRPRPPKSIAAFLLLTAAYSLFDQSRWQPWLYQYLFMLAAVGLSYRRPDDEDRRDSALESCRWIVAAVYFWSGVHKANPSFGDVSFSWMTEPFMKRLPEAANHWIPLLGYAAPVIETSIGAGLLTRRFRTAAIIGALAMHAFILASIGPLAHNFDSVVWPWNIAMAFLVVLLFRAPRERRLHWWAGTPLFQRLVLLLFGVAPVLNFVNLMDAYPSFALYSGNTNAATIYMSDEVAGRLPDTLQEQTDVNDSGVDELSVFDWSFAELNVPPYAELRVYRQIGKQVCAFAGFPRDMVLIVQGKSAWIGRRQQYTYDCAGLAK